MTHRESPPPSLLDRVSADLGPVRPSPLPWRRVLWLAPIALALYLGVPLIVGLRRDAAALGPVLAWGLSASQVMFALLLIGLSAREGIPGRRLPQSRLFVTLVGAGAAVLLVTLGTFLVSPTHLPEGLTPASANAFCFRGGLVLGSPFLFLIGWQLSRALPARPWLAGALYGAGAGLTIDAAWRLVCPVSDPRHVLTAHGGTVLSMVLLGTVTAIAASRLTRRR